MQNLLEILQELGKVDVTLYSTNDIFEIQDYLYNNGYATEFVSTDRDYLRLIK